MSLLSWECWWPAWSFRVVQWDKGICSCKSNQRKRAWFTPADTKYRCCFFPRTRFMVLKTANGAGTLIRWYRHGDPWTARHEQDLLKARQGQSLGDVLGTFDSNNRCCKVLRHNNSCRKQHGELAAVTPVAKRVLGCQERRDHPESEKT